MKPTYLKYEYTPTELKKLLNGVFLKTIGEEIDFRIMEWSDNDFSVIVSMNTSDEVQEKIIEVYGELEGTGLTDAMIGDLFGIDKEPGRFIKYYHDHFGHFFIEVALDALNRYKEAWAQADEISETLDAVLNEKEAWAVRDILRDRALAVRDLIGDLVPEDMIDYEPLEDPRKVRNEKGEVDI